VVSESHGLTEFDKELACELEIFCDSFDREASSRHRP
jgi:hypothetical protein